MKDVEQVLLSNASLDELIKIKIEEEFKSGDKKREKNANKIVVNIQEVPKDIVFSKRAVFRVYNRKNKSETLINGIQADALIGIQQSIREKLLDGCLSAFSTDEAFVKFEKAVL